MLIMVLLCPFAYGKVIYVDDDAAGANVGSSWNDAINSLQDALLLAYFYDEPVEIRVAQGTYTPDQGIGIMPGDREASFQLLNNVTIKGGYAGLGTRDPEMRDIDRYTSILSGDLNSNDSPRQTNKEENSYHVVTAKGINATAVLDGFTITGGTADGWEPNNGGGMVNENSNPILINCTFKGNSAPISGGGMFNHNSNLTLLNCIFTGNSAARSGGGMYNNDSSATLTNCAFIDNAGGDSGGGGMYNTQSILLLADCTFSENLTEGSGGGIHNNNSNAELLNCDFRANSSRVSGGGIYSDSQSELNSTNCIFSRNSARTGGGLENIRGSNSIFYNCTFTENSAGATGGGLSNTLGGQLTLINCILWGDTPDEISGLASFSYSNIKNSLGIWSDWLGTTSGNIDIDPQFADPDNGDYHLKSQAGRWDPAIESWVIDEVSSPCIDAGDPTIPVGLERFPNGDRINMGAYGGTPQASLSPLQLPLLYSKAYNPYPPDGVFNVDEDVILSWTAGLNAVFHDVYFGIDRDVVSSADISSIVYQGRQATTSFNPSGGAELSDGTYYWRIDEVGSEGKIIKGEVWSFTIGSPPKGRACFTGEIPVWVDGKLIPISIVASAQVISGISGLNKIEQVQEHNGIFDCYDILLESGKSITVAENHYFMSDSGQWLAIQNLKTATRLKTSKGSIGIASVTKKPEPYIGKVYNLKIEGSDKYTVGEDAIIVRDY